MRKFLRTTALALGFLSLFTGLANAQTYVNSNLSTGATLSTGAAAPAGTTWSEVQAGNTTAGFNAAITVGAFRIADNFVIPAGPNWNITGMRFYGYQTGYAGTASPFTTIRITIHSGTVTGPVVFGDQVTNRFAGSAFANMYRVFNATNDLTRRIWSIDANVNVSLAPGTYWIEYATDVTGGGGHFLPNSTVTGTVTQPGNNAQSLTIATNTWAPALDGSNPQDMPFTISYNTGACTGTPNPGNTVTSATAVCPSTSFNLSLQNATLGSGVTYQWYSAPAATGPWTPIATATNSTYTVPAITATTFYQAVVTCSGNSGTSVPVQVTANPPSACYCVPPASDCTDDDVIENVTIGGMSKTTTCAANGYANYTGTDTATIIRGANNPITVRTGDSWTEQVGVWIDYDRSGSFETSEFTNLGSTAAGSGGNHIGQIAVPAGTALGYTRMRVRVRFSTALTGAQACLGYTFGETEDYTVNIVPCVPNTITTQPVNTTVACGANSSFTVAIAGSLPVVYWEYRPNATTPWQNVPAAAPYSGVNTNTLTISPSTSSLNGYQYRAVFQGACTAVDFSNTATLTVNPLVGSVTKTPTGNICLGGIQQLSITNAQPATTVTFNSAAALNIAIPDNGTSGGVNNTIAISGIPAGVLITDIRVRMNLTHTWAGDMIVVVKAPNNKVLNLAYALNATGGPSATTGFQPTFAKTATALTSTGSNPYSGVYAADGYNPTTGDPTVPTGPTGYLPTSVAPTRNNFNDLYPPADNSSTLNGNWTLAMYDYFDDGLTTNRFNNWSVEITYTGGLATGVWTGPAGTIFTDAAATTAYTGTSVNTVYVKPTTTGLTNYSVVVNNGVCTSAALTVPVTVNQLATSVTRAGNKTICANGTTSFTAAVTGGSGNTIQWQVSPDGINFTNITDGGVYSGATTTTLTITGAGTSLSNNKYRAVASAAPCTGTVNSIADTLTVNPNPVIVLSANPNTRLIPGMTTTLTAAVNPNPAATYTWFRDGVQVLGATGNTYVVDVDKLGTYHVAVEDVNGCSAVSNNVTVADSTSDILFIYPSPNSGQFQVRYFSASGNTTLPRTLTVYDSKGARVFTKTYTISSPYSVLEVDMSNHATGIYMVELGDRSGRRLKTGRVVIR